MKLLEIIKDSKGSLSSRRVGFFAMLALFGTAFLANLFFGKTIDEQLLADCYYVLLAGLVSIGYDQYEASRTKRRGTGQ